MHHIFGYGSLINADSRAKTGVSGEAIPARVRGWQRAWNFHSAGNGMTVLGVVPSEEAACNGVLAPVPEEQLQRFDAREGGYTRTPLQPRDCTALGDHELRAENCWIYVPGTTATPTQELPIAQSYVDVVLAGCLTINQAFAEEFVRTTGLWDSPWINDRKQARYPRAMTPSPILERVDSLLTECGRRRPD